MKPLTTALIAIIVSAATVAGMNFLPLNAPTVTAVSEQPAFERVMRTRTLRCAYLLSTPELVINPSSNRISGAAFDIMQQMGVILGLKIEWAAAVEPAVLAAELQSGREDALCMTLWPTGERAADFDFTAPLYFSRVQAYVRADDTRFDGDLSKLNDSAVTIAVTDNSYSRAIAREDAPQAKIYAALAESGNAGPFLAVTRQNADAVFADPATAEEFMKNNPNTIRAVANAPPLRVFGNSYVVAKGETKLRDMMDVALQQMQASGFIRATLDKYLGEHRGDYFYPARGWE